MLGEVGPQDWERLQFLRNIYRDAVIFFGGGNTLFLLAGFSGTGEIFFCTMRKGL
jgi:peptidase E